MPSWWRSCSSASGRGSSIAKGFDKLEAQQPLQHAGWVYLVLAVALLFQLGSLARWPGGQLGDGGAPAARC